MLQKGVIVKIKRPVYYNWCKTWHKNFIIQDCLYMLLDTPSNNGNVLSINSNHKLLWINVYKDKIKYYSMTKGAINRCFEQIIQVLKIHKVSNIDKNYLLWLIALYFNPVTEDTNYIIHLYKTGYKINEFFNDSKIFLSWFK